MISIATWLESSPTQTTGVAAYSIALACCIFAGSRARGDVAKARLAALLAFCEGCLLIDMVFNIRWHIHQYFMDRATQLALYATRRGPQAVVLIVLLVAFIFGLRLAGQKFRGRSGAFLAVSGALLSVSLWCTEAVSLHAVDHILYHPIGKWLPVSFIWVLGCLMTSFGILVESKAVRRRFS
jgi:hypothetical protein